MDVDPNYDPSDFLMAGLPPRNVKPEDEQNEEKQLESSFEVSAVSIETFVKKVSIVN